MNKRKSMAIIAEHLLEPPGNMYHAPNEEWIARVGELQEVLAVCPTDIVAESELATLLEQLGQWEQALCHWNAILACDPNSLNAREGVARCRRNQRLQPGL
ncbi:MAG TPA: hypothetical protein VJU02_08165 [Nitrospiraceae bacterium]|nr:hypothetical protein [Nitrospiraceae bacterium]